jgi:hypothetical protein
MLRTFRLVNVELMTFRCELNEFGLEPRGIVQCSGIEGHDFRRVMGRSK